MRCFLVEIRFLKPFSDFGDAVARHRAYLQQGYDQGMLLLSGPKDDRSAGICIARADDEAAIRAFFDQDPYRLEKLAEHVIIAFTAAKYQSFLETWINPV